VDSSAWLEYFADGPNADAFAAAIEDMAELITPTIGIHEVFKRVPQQRSDSDALRAVALMQLGHVVELSPTLALDAARISVDDRLPMADSVMLATARAWGATLWTQDSDPEGKVGVKFVRSMSAGTPSVPF
jgi:toxin FitB